MDTLFVSSVNPVAVGTLNTPEPVTQHGAGGLAAHGQLSGTPALTTQDLAKSLFQQSLQAAALYPVSEPVSGSAGLAQDAMNSLLAALNPAQAPADTNPPAAPTVNPSPTVPTSAGSTTGLQDLPATQDGFGTSLNPDFAMQTALRFGAGVAIQAAAALAPTSHEEMGPVRDATAVLRMGNLQPHEGSPGPEAFAHPQVAIQTTHRPYETPPVLSPAPGASSLDLIA